MWSILAAARKPAVLDPGCPACAPCHPPDRYSNALLLITAISGGSPPPVRTPATSAVPAHPRPPHAGGRRLYTTNGQETRNTIWLWSRCGEASLGPVGHLYDDKEFFCTIIFWSLFGTKSNITVYSFGRSVGRIFGVAKQLRGEVSISTSSNNWQAQAPKDASVKKIGNIKYLTFALTFLKIIAGIPHIKVCSHRKLPQDFHTTNFHHLAFTQQTINVVHIIFPQILLTLRTSYRMNSEKGGGAWGGWKAWIFWPNFTSDMIPMQ